MLVTLKDILKLGEEQNKAIGAFDCSGLECVMAITDAATRLGNPVILQYAELHQNLIPFEIISPIMLAAAERAPVPVCVLLDHGESIESCKAAIDAGYSAVMYDGSAKSFEENVSNTRKVVEYAHARGVSVEAELGNIFASELGAGERSEIPDVSGEDAYTDPDMAKEFIERTGADALAVAFGTSHGVYLTKPVLDLDRIALIREKVSVPLVMHGGSGLTKEDYQTAIKNGIRKINYYTYMVMEGGKAVAQEIEKGREAGIYFFHDLACVGKEAMQKKVEEVIHMFALK